MTFKEDAHADAKNQVPEFASNDYTPSSLTLITRLAVVKGWEAAMEYIANQEPSEAEIDAASKAHWQAYEGAIQNAPSNRDGEGVSEEDGRAAGRAGRRASIRAALAVRLSENLPQSTLPPASAMVEESPKHAITTTRFTHGVRVNCTCGWMDRWIVNDGSAEQSGAAHVARETKKENR